jgi:hypothetical protein
MFLSDQIVILDADIKCDCCNHIITCGRSLLIKSLRNKRRKLYMVYDQSSFSIHRIKLTDKVAHVI